MIYLFILFFFPPVQRVGGRWSRRGDCVILPDHRACWRWRTAPLSVASGTAVRPSVCLSLFDRCAPADVHMSGWSVKLRDRGSPLSGQAKSLCAHLVCKSHIRSDVRYFRSSNSFSVCQQRALFLFLFFFFFRRSCSTDRRPALTDRRWPCQGDPGRKKEDKLDCEILLLEWYFHV